MRVLIDWQRVLFCAGRSPPAMNSPRSAADSSGASAVLAFQRRASSCAISRASTGARAGSRLWLYEYQLGLPKAGYHESAARSSRPYDRKAPSDRNQGRPQTVPTPSLFEQADKTQKPAPTMGPASRKLTVTSPRKAPALLVATSARSPASVAYPVARAHARRHAPPRSRRWEIENPVAARCGTSESSRRSIMVPLADRGPPWSPAAGRKGCPNRDRPVARRPIDKR